MVAECWGMQISQHFSIDKKIGIVMLFVGKWYAPQKLDTKGEKTLEGAFFMQRKKWTVRSAAMGII